MTYAIFTTGGHQFRAEPGLTIQIPLLAAEPGSKVTFDRVLLTCYRYDPASRRYAFFVSTFLRTGGLLVFGALSIALAVFWRREFKRGQVV